MKNNIKDSEQMNKGFLSRAFDKPIRDEYPTKGIDDYKVMKLIMDKGTPYHVRWLCDLDSALPLRVHFPNIICNRMYSDSMGCPECEKVSTYKGVSRPNTPKTTWSILGYVYDLVDKVYVSKKTGKEYPEYPVKVVEITGGKGAINFEGIEQYHNSGILKDDVWILRRLPEMGLDKPTVADLRLLGKQFDPTLPKEIANKYNTMSPADLRGLIFSTYENAKFDHPDIKEAGIAKPRHLIVTDETSLDPLD